MSELFPEKEVTKPSPKLEWMRRHGIVMGMDKTERIIEGELIAKPVLCCHTILVHAKTEEEALHLMARKLGIKHYTEEEFERTRQPTWED